MTIFIGIKRKVILHSTYPKVPPVVHALCQWPTASVKRHDKCIYKLCLPPNIRPHLPRDE